MLPLGLPYDYCDYYHCTNVESYLYASYKHQALSGRITAPGLNNESRLRFETEWIHM